MKFIEAARSAPARYALAYAGVTALVISVLLGLIYSWMTALLTRHLEQTAQHQLSVLVDAYEQDNMALLLLLAETQTRSNTQPAIRIIIQSPTGESLLGNVPEFTPSDGWQDIKVSGSSADPANSAPMYYRSLGAYLDNGTFILVMHNTADLQQTQQLLTRSFVSALAVTTAMALLGGLLIGDAMLRRVEAVNSTASAIMQGDFTHRIPSDGRHNELGDLTENLNHMFARIQTLMEDLRHVSSSIAHDLRSPMGRHRQKLEAVLLDADSTEDDCRLAIGSAIQDVDALLKTFDAMLRITEIETGQLRRMFYPVDLSLCVNNVIDAYTVVAEDQGKVIQSHIESNVTVLGVQKLLSQTIVNIIENALRHTPPHAQIAITLNICVDQPILTIADNGAGIPESERDNVFLRFYRLDSSRPTPGSGLGVSFVKAVTILHQASIRLEDASPGLSVVIEITVQDEPR